MKVPKQDKALHVQVYHDTRGHAPDKGVSYLHCGRCLDELRADERLAATFSPKTYARTQVAITKDGLQVWCTRHEMNVDHMRMRAVRKEDE